MPACPVCRDEFEADVTACPTHGEALVPVDELPPPPERDAPLGLFHPAAALVVQRFLTARTTGFRRVEVDDDRVELWVPAAARDDLRAALTLNWTAMLQAVEPEDREQVLAAGGDQPGWHDPPRGAWLDDDGRLRVEPTPDEAAVQDAQRTIGPALVVVGGITLLLSWLNGFDAGPVLFGVSAVVLGLLLPR